MQAGLGASPCTMECCLRPAPAVVSAPYVAPRLVPAGLPLAPPLAASAPLPFGDTGLLPGASPPGIERHILLQVFRN
jgi:hypothetical protein